MALKPLITMMHGSSQMLFVDDSDTGAAALNADLVAKLAAWDPAVNPCISIAGRGVSGDKGGGTFHRIAAAGGPAVDNAMVFLTGNPAWLAVRDFTDHLCPDWFGTEGDGTTNDTAALQHGLDATITWGVPLRCDAGATYLVRYTGATWNGYALKFKNGTRCDLNGATIKLDNDQWCSCILNEHVSGGGTDHVELYNGTINGNQTGQTKVWDTGAWRRAPAGTPLTHTPTLLMINLDTPIFTDLTIIDGYIDAMQIQSATAPYFDGVTIDGCWGDGHIIKDCTDVYVDDLSVSDCAGLDHTPAWGSAYGNGLIWKLVRGSIGTVTLTNCRGPAKVQVSTTDLVWDKLLCIAGPLTCLPTLDPIYQNWWGIKLQGDAPGTPNIRVKINAIVCDASDPTINFATQSIGAGLYINNSSDTEIGTCTCICCGRGFYSPGCDYKDYNAVRVFDAPHLKIGRILTDRCDGGTISSQHSTGLLTEYIDVDEIVAVDPQYALRAGATHGASLLADILDCHLHVKRMRLTENTAPPFPTTLVAGGSLATDFTASILVDDVMQNRPLHALSFACNPDADIARVQIGRVRVDGLVGRSEGTQTLTNGSATTAVVAEEISSWDTLTPIISVHPLNGSAAALGPIYGIAESAPASGLTLQHAVAGASDLVSWKNLGYSSLAGLVTPRVWSTLTIGGAKPSARAWVSACYIPTLDLTLLFGGASAAGAYLGDTWQFDHATRVWTQLFPATSPTACYGALLAYDSLRGRLVLFGGKSAGGLLATTYEYYAGNWHAVAPAHSPPAQNSWSSTAMAFDAVRNVCVFYGGPNLGSAGWWEYDGVDWTQTGGALPNGVYEHCACAFNPALARAVVFGGSDGVNPKGDIYEWDGATLTGYVTAWPSLSHFMVWDSIRSLMVIASIDGGGGGIGMVDKTLELTGHSTMTEVNPMPTVRAYAAGVYCPTMAEAMAFGGTPTGAYGGAVDTTIVFRRG